LGFHAYGVRSILNCRRKYGIVIAEISRFHCHESSHERAAIFVEYGAYADVTD